MQHDGNDNSSLDLNFSSLEQEFEAWRRSWLESLIDDYGMLSYAMSDGAGFIKRCLSEDGLHPTPAGYQIMARVAEGGMDSALPS